MKHKEISNRALEAFNNTKLPRVFDLDLTGKKGNDPVEIILYDIIGTDTTNAETFSAALLAAGDAPLTLRLSSPGGSVFEGWAMYNSLKQYPGETTVIVDGVAASIASVLALAGKKVLTQETSLWMVHNAWVNTTGNSAELRASADILDKIDNNLVNVYISKTGKDRETVIDWMVNEQWFESSEAVSVGLADALASNPTAKEKAAEAADKAQLAAAQIGLAELSAKGGATIEELAKLTASGEISINEARASHRAKALNVRRQRAALLLSIAKSCK